MVAVAMVGWCGFVEMLSEREVLWGFVGGE
jgi:hypothetical protein